MNNDCDRNLPQVAIPRSSGDQALDKERDRDLQCQ